MAKAKIPAAVETAAEATGQAETAEARKERLRGKIEKLLAHREKAKREYGKAGSLLNELIREMKPGESVPLTDGRIATLKDAFANANYVYRNTSFTRLDLDVTG